MKNPLPFLPLLLVGCLLLCTRGPSAEQGEDASTRDDTSQPAPSSLAIRQEGVSSDVRNLEQKLLRLAQLLREEDPRQAERLSEALKSSRETMLRKRMERISFLLNELDLDAATAEQQEIIGDLLALLEALTEEDDYYERLREHLEQLEEWRRQINELSREEWRQMRESQKASDPERASRQLAERIARLKSLLKQQKKVTDDTGQARESGAPNMTQLAQQQREVRKGTQSLRDEISRADGEEPRDGEDEAPAQGTSGQTSPAESQHPEPGQEALTQATQRQEQSENNLTSGKARSAEDAQEKALDAMKRALEELEREKQKLDSLSPDGADRMAEQQDQTARATGSLAEQMSPPGDQQPGSSGGQAGQGEQGGGQSGAKKSLQQARKSMEGASGQLRNKQPGPASQKQKKAHQELQQARREIEKELSQLRKEQRGALLAKLIGMFRRMLDRQEEITARTADLQKIKRADEWGRTESLRCAELSDGERKLIETAAEALQIMEENSPAVVFPNAVRGLQEDLDIAADRLGEEKTGQTTRGIQNDIERTLEDLINALEMAQEIPPPSDQQQQSGEGQQSDRRPPLVSMLAEIQLLRNMQQRINRRTETLREQTQKNDAAPDAHQRAETLSHRQRTVRQMTEELREKIRRAFHRQQQQQQEPPTL